MDWTVYEDSRIERLPRLARPVALAARNLVGMFPKPHAHQFDGMTTRHNDGFRETPSFRKAYARAVQAGGWDFGIPYRVHQALWCASIAPEGAIVELGTGRGFVMSAVMTEHPTRELHLFDTFLPAYPNKAGKQVGKASPHYAVSLADVTANFAEWPSVRLHPGDVYDTIPASNIERVAFLHVDLNFAPAEIFGIRHFWPLMVPGAVLLLDDYAHADYHGLNAAINDLAKEFGFSVLSTPTGQGIAIKQ